MSTLALGTSPNCHLHFSTLASVFSAASGMSKTAPCILPMRKRPRANTIATPYDSARLPFAKKLRSQSYPHSTISLRRPAVVIFQQDASGRPTILARPPRSSARTLRKAAILNRARRHGWTVPSPNLPGTKPDIINCEDTRGEADELIARRIQNTRAPLPPSPLGLSNYEELDQWHGYHRQYDDDDPGGVFDVPEDDDSDQPYSDFNFLDPETSGSPEEDDDDYDNPFPILPTRLHKSDQQPEVGAAASSLPVATGCSPNWTAAAGEVRCGG